MKKIGILAFGSLRKYPGRIGDYKIEGIGAETPFPVEYARRSRSRGGAPTLAPHEKGGKVKAEVLVLSDDIGFEDARDLLWRRERNKEDSNDTYSVGIGPNHVLVHEWRDCPEVERVLIPTSIPPVRRF